MSDTRASGSGVHSARATDAGDSRARESSSAPKGLDDYSEVLGMTPREHERRMRKWYVLLAIVGFFGVFGEGILVMLARSRAAVEAGAGAPVESPALSR